MHDTSDEPDLDKFPEAPSAIHRNPECATACLQRLTAWSLLAVAIWALMGTERSPTMAPVVELSIDINHADEREIRLLPTIGPKLAERIVHDRILNGPFSNLEDLARVDGIGGKTLDLISNYCCVPEPTTETSRSISNRSMKRLPIGSTKHQIVSR